MLRRFLKDIRGNYMILTAVAIVPIMGGLAVAVDYTNLSRQRQETLNSLDAAGIATARYISEGATDEQATAYAHDFFETNLGAVNPADASLTVTLPKNNTGGGTLKLRAEMTYHPYFLPAFTALIGKSTENTDLAFSAVSEVRLKNTLEVALVLDNSGSMAYTGSGSGSKRIDLLKDAAKKLVDTLAAQGEQLKQLPKPVQFGLVPFAASVNIGPQYDDAPWMDTMGVSPIHHENFDWSTLTNPLKTAEKVGDVWYKRGIGWGLEKDEPLTRFSLYEDMKSVVSREWVSTGREWVCTKYKRGRCKKGEWQDTGYYNEVLGQYANWQGCVESRPYPFNVTDAPATSTDNASYFVPMFAPDEAGDRWSIPGTTYNDFDAANNWWNDGIEGASASARQKYMQKYFDIMPMGASSGSGNGPNYSCTTNPITPLTDVTTGTGKSDIKDAIDAMQPNGATNVPEGMAWGWRVVSGGAPFTEGRADTEKGNDKVVIVLTDGANTYYTPGSLGSDDDAGNKSTYSAYGYAGKGYNGTSTARLFLNTSSAVGKSDYSNGNYTDALNEQFATLCDNAKANNIIVMTVSLDLSTSKSSEKKQIDAMKACSSDSRFRKDPNNPSKPAKLYWNATGSSLAQSFKEIADELSNLRIVG